MVVDIAWLVGGLVLLVFAADWLVDGAVGIARRLAIPPLVVGLTIVAYGTSLPEFVVSLLAAQRGVAEFAIGNIVGSNIANIGLVLGAAALIHPIVVRGGTLFRRDLPILLVTTVGGTLAFLDGRVSRVEGGLLLLAALVFTVWCLRAPETESTADDEPADSGAPWPRALLVFAVGIAGLVIAADRMVFGASNIAAAMGIDERIVGLTVVALGTSLPELAASVAGALKGHAGIAVGNVLGSCFFNLAFVLGASALITPLPANPSTMTIDLAMMGGLTVAMWVMLATGRRMSRPEGGALIAAYVGFMGFLTWQALG